MNNNFKNYINNDEILTDWLAKEEALNRELSYIEYCAVKSLSLPDSKRILILSDHYNNLPPEDSFFKNSQS